MSDQIKLLIVDDEIQFLKSIARRLELRGFDVTKATNGIEALKAAESGGFDLALLDLKMPGMDGQEVLKRLKQEHQFLEVLILTGHGSIDSAVECTKLGAFGYLSKPYELEKLLEILKEAYESRLKKKYSADQEKILEIEAVAAQLSPEKLIERAQKDMVKKPSLLDIFRELRGLDDDRK